MSHIKKELEQKIRKHYLLAMAISCMVLYALSVFVVAPLYASLSNNVIYKSSWIIYVPEFALELLELAVYTVAFAFFAYANHILYTKKATPFLLIYILLLIFRRAAAIGMGILSYGSLDIFELQSSLWYIVLDMITAGIVFFFAARKASHYQAACLTIQKLRDRLSEPTEEPVLYPFSSSFSKSNSLQVCAAFTAGFLTLEKIVSRIIFDAFYGAPADFSEVLVMAIYYLTDILMGLLIYIGMLWLFGRMHRHADRVQAKEAEIAKTTAASKQDS